MMICSGCGEEHDYPWGFCQDCTAILIDVSREPKYRLNSPEKLAEQIAKIVAYDLSSTPEV